MSTLVYTLIAIVYLSTGRRLYALRQCLEVAKTMAFDKLIPLVEEAIAHDIRTVAMENAWTRSRRVSKARGESVQIDNRIDAVLGAVFKRLKEPISVLKESSPVVIASKKIIDQLFPEGVQPIITLPFEEQLVRNQTILDRLTDESDLAKDAGTTNLTPFIEELLELNNRFKDQLDKSKTKEIGYDTLEAARDQGNLHIRQIAAVVLGTYYRTTTDDAEKRQALLTPFLEQAERISQARKGRRGPQDIDPDSGEELPGEE